LKEQPDMAAVDNELEEQPDMTAVDNVLKEQPDTAVADKLEDLLEAVCTSGDTIEGEDCNKCQDKPDGSIKQKRRVSRCQWRLAAVRKRVKRAALHAFCVRPA
jgi:hypothetical protein